MEARVRQTVSGVKTAMDAKKVEGETKELTEKIVALETTVEEAVNSAPEKLKEEPTDETLAEIEKTVKISQEKIQLEIKALSKHSQDHSDSNLLSTLESVHGCGEKASLIVFLFGYTDKRVILSLSHYVLFFLRFVQRRSAVCQLKE